MKKILTLALILISNFCNAMDFYFTNDDGYGGKSKFPTPVMVGPIKNGDNIKLIEFLKVNKKYFEAHNGIRLSSLGGDIEEAFKIAETIKNTYELIHITPQTGRCASACFIIFSAAVRREAKSNLIGIHRPYLNHQTMRASSITDAEKSQDYISSKTSSFLNKNGVPKYIIEILFSKSSNEIYWLNDSDLEKIGEMSPWFEQFSISKCNYNKELVSKHFKEFTNLPARNFDIEQMYECINKEALLGKIKFLNKLN